ncbi:MAG: hypothetical protein R3236_06655 [Phycisphaeraceae bacterium]|nr:hypothetical protein [Phycisphaeraceae bacterium]
MTVTRPVLKATLFAGACLAAFWGYHITQADAPAPRPVSAVSAGSDRELSADEAMVFEVGRHDFTESSSGKNVPMGMGHHPEDPRFPWRFRLGDRIDHLSVDESGGVTMGRSEDLYHDTLTLFDPPLPWLQDLETGQWIEAKASMTIRDRDRPDLIKDRGTCTLRLEYVGWQSVRTGRTERKAFAICRRFSAALSVACVEEQTDQWFGPGLGLLAEQSVETVSAFVPLWSTQHHRIRND